MPRLTPALSRFVCLSIVVVAAIAATGCATRSARPISDRFVRQGKPTVDYGGAPPTPTAAYVAQLRKLAQLHEEGVLSDAHYETAKRRILDQT